MMSLIGQKMDVPEGNYWSPPKGKSYKMAKAKVVTHRKDPVGRVRITQPPV